MRKKTKGATLIELIIVMGLTLVIMSAAYSFLNTSNKSTMNENLKSTLQSEGNIIEDKILTIGTQAVKAISIETDDGEIIDKKISNSNLKGDGSFNLSKLQLQGYNDDDTYTIELIGNDLNITTSDGSVRTLSRYVTEFIAQPLNFNQLTEKEKSEKKMSDISGYKLSFKLKAKKGVAEVKYDISVQVNFRNYDVKSSKAKQEFNRIQTTITNLWGKSKELYELSNKESITTMNDKAININKIGLKQYDGSIEYVTLSGGKLLVGNEDSKSTKFENVVDFQIQAMDTNIENKQIKDINSFKILVTLEEENEKADKESLKYTYEMVVKFGN